MKFTLFTIILLITTQLIFAQITKDTVLANTYFTKAEALKNSSEFDSAIVYFNKASYLYEKHNLWLKYLLSETQHGDCYSKLWKLDKAIKIIKPAIENTTVQIGENDTIVADAYNTIGIQYYYQSKLDSTLLYFHKTLKIRKEVLGEKHIKVANSYNNIGLLYDIQSKYDQALQYYYKDLAISKGILGEKHTGVAHTYNNIGVVYYYKSEYNKALEYFNKGLKIRKELFGEKHIDVIGSYNNIAAVYQDKSEYDNALQYNFKNLEIEKELLGKKHIYVSASYNNIGVIYFNKSEYNKALQYFFMSLEIKKELYGEKHIDVADAYNNIGNVYDCIYEYDKALEYQFKALKILKELNSEKNIQVAASYNNIGKIYYHKLEYQKALEFILKSLELKKELLGEKHILIVKSYSNIGTLFADKHEYNKALEYYFKNIEILKELFGEKHILLSQTYNSIGDVFRDSLQYKIALKYYHLGITANLKDFNDTTDITKVPVMKNYIEHKALLQSLQAKAEIFADTTKTLQGFQNLIRFKLALQHYRAADTLISLARKDISTKSDKLALGEQANEIYKGAVNICINLSAFLKPESVYFSQAFYFSERNKSSVLLQALSEAEALKFSGIPDNLLNLEHKLSIALSNYTNLKNNAENDSLKNIWSNKLFDTQRSYDSLIVVFETKYPEYYNLKYNNSPVSVPQLSELLSKKTAILSYFVGDSTITIFAISKNDFIVVETRQGVSLQKKETRLGVSIQDMINDYRFYISNTELLADEVMYGTHKSVSLYQELAYEFYNLLFPPEIQEFLKGGIFYNIKNLIIIPDAQLATIPFETFHTEEYNAEWTNWKNKEYFANMPFLIKDYNISYSYSATLFAETRPKQNTNEIELTPLNDWLAYAPVFDDENTAGTTTRTRQLLTQNDSLTTRRFLTDGTYITPLPGTESEVKTIFDLYENNNKKAVIKTHLQANEGSVKSDELQNYRILHFATHGFVNETDPELSGILFAQDTTKTLQGFENLIRSNAEQNEGILYQSEIYNLNFKADLVVLSACETGLGKITEGEGVIGLTRALLYAGSKNIIVSLWQVSDASTSELMINFYENLLSEKKPYKVSKDLIRFNKPLSEAKRQMIKDKKYAHPYFWSPFILIGE